VHLVYPGRTEATTKELTVTKQVLVINPIVPAALAIVLLVTAGLFWWRRRRRRLAKTPRTVR
jgi:LPXTG-motif cell wall-anchored protein